MPTCIEFEFAAIAAVVEPTTSFPPVFKKGMLPPAIDYVSELPVTIKWEVSDDAFPTGTFKDKKPAVWTVIEGQTGKTLDETNLKAGQWVRCTITNAAGSTVSAPVQKK